MVYPGRGGGQQWGTATPPPLIVVGRPLTTLQVLGRKGSSAHSVEACTRFSVQVNEICQVKNAHFEANCEKRLPTDIQFCLQYFGELRSRSLWSRNYKFRLWLHDSGAEIVL